MVSSYSAEPVRPCALGLAAIRAAAQRAVAGRSRDSTAPPRSPSAMTTMATNTTTSGGRPTTAENAITGLTVCHYAVGVARFAAMRSGDHYLASLDDGRAVFLDGERVGDVTKHTALAEPIRSMEQTWDRERAPAGRLANDDGD